jgi:hypothetical protein
VVLPATVPLVPPEQKVVVVLGVVSLKTVHSRLRGMVPEPVMETLVVVLVR